MALENMEFKDQICLIWRRTKRMREEEKRKKKKRRREGVEIKPTRYGTLDF